MRAVNTMTYRTAIERDTLTTDGGGGFTEQWDTSSADVRCRAWYQAGQYLVLEGRPQMIDVRIVLVPLGTDVKEGDRLPAVTDRKGKVIFDGPLMVDAVGEFPDHLRLTTRRIS